jgi:hypothetical protein
VNLPVSKIVSDRWTIHGNAGATLLPDIDGQISSAIILARASITQ